MNSAHSRQHGLAQRVQPLMQLSALAPQRCSERGGRTMATEPLANQQLTQLAGEPRRGPVRRDVQPADLHHTVLHLHVQLGRAAEVAVREFKRRLDAELGRLAEGPLPALQLRRRLAQSRERRLVLGVDEVRRSAEAKLCDRHSGVETNCTVTFTQWCCLR